MSKYALDFDAQPGKVEQPAPATGITPPALGKRGRDELKKDAEQRRGQRQDAAMFDPSANWKSLQAYSRQTELLPSCSRGTLQERTVSVSGQRNRCKLRAMKLE